MNERPVSGSGKLVANVHFWVIVLKNSAGDRTSPTTRNSVAQISWFSQVGYRWQSSIGPLFQDQGSPLGLREFSHTIGRKQH